MIKVSSRAFSLLFPVFFLLFVSPVCREGEDHTSDHSSREVMRGERLFYGLIDGKFESKACADCHNTVEIDTFNWNPNAWEIARKFAHKSLEEFQKAVLSPTSQTMSEMHQTFHLNESDLELIKRFLDDFNKNGLFMLSTGFVRSRANLVPGNHPYLEECKDHHS